MFRKLESKEETKAPIKEVAKAENKEETKVIPE